MTAKFYERLSCNSGRRYIERSFQGRKYIVAPLSLIVPGVLTGNRGPLLYPEEEVFRDPDAWNGMPMVANHPVSADGRNLSGRDPEVISKFGLGYVFKARRSERGKLVAEGWFDPDAVQRVAPQLMQNLRTGTPIELSTGLFTENIPAPIGATHNGVPYSFIARNYKPDHLAILLGQSGACSIKDGCGVFNYSPKQPRDNRGRWSAGGGKGRGSSKASGGGSSGGAGGPVSSQEDFAAQRKKIEEHFASGERYFEGSTKREMLSDIKKAEKGGGATQAPSREQLKSEYQAALKEVRRNPNDETWKKVQDTGDAYRNDVRKEFFGRTEAKLKEQAASKEKYDFSSSKGRKAAAEKVDQDLKKAEQKFVKTRSPKALQKLQDKVQEAKKVESASKAGRTAQRQARAVSRAASSHSLDPKQQAKLEAQKSLAQSLLKRKQAQSLLDQKLSSRREQTTQRSVGRPSRISSSISSAFATVKKFLTGNADMPLQTETRKTIVREIIRNSSELRGDRVRYANTLMRLSDETLTNLALNAFNPRQPRNSQGEWSSGGGGGKGSSKSGGGGGGGTSSSSEGSAEATGERKNPLVEPVSQDLQRARTAYAADPTPEKFAEVERIKKAESEASKGGGESSGERKNPLIEPSSRELQLAKTAYAKDPTPEKFAEIERIQKAETQASGIKKPVGSQPSEGSPGKMLQQRAKEQSDAIDKLNEASDRHSSNPTPENKQKLDAANEEFLKAHNQFKEASAKAKAKRQEEAQSPKESQLSPETQKLKMQREVESMSKFVARELERDPSSGETGSVASKINIIAFRTGKTFEQVREELSAGKKKMSANTAVNNCQCQGEVTENSEGDEEILSQLPEEFLSRLASNGGSMPEDKKKKMPPVPQSGEDPADPTQDGESDVEVPPTKGGKKAMSQATTNERTHTPQTVEEYLANAPAEVREIIANSREVLAREKGAIITRLTKHVQNEERKKELVANLSGKTLPELRDLADMLPPEVVQNNANIFQPSFFGAQGGAPTTNSASRGREEAPLVPVTMDYVSNASPRLMARLGKVQPN